MAVLDLSESEVAMAKPAPVGCLELVGSLTVADGAHTSLLRYAETGGSLEFATVEQREESATRVAHMLQMIVATREFQFA